MATHTPRLGAEQWKRAPDTPTPVREPFLRSGYIPGFEMFCIAKITVLKLRDKTQNSSVPRAVLSQQLTATTRNWKKGFSSCWLEKTPPWWGTRGRWYWSNCKAEQHKVLPQTFNYKHTRLGKQGGAAAGRPWVSRPRGGEAGWEGGPGGKEAEQAW